MATTYTPSLRLAQMQTGDPQVKNNWGVVLDAMIAAVEQAIVGSSPIDISGRTTYTLTTASNAPDQARQPIYNFIGALTGSCVVTVPSVPKIGWIVNNTTGGFFIALTTSGGNQSIFVPPARIAMFTCDGTSVSIPQPFLPTPLFSSGPNFPAITGSAGSSRALFFSGIANRWALGAGGENEGGGNTGSNFDIWRYSDAGNLIDSPFWINRATGQTNVSSLVSSQPITAPNGTSGTQVVNWSQFSPTVATNGATFLPGNVLFQWGSFVGPLVVDGSFAGVTFNWPFPFQHNLFAPLVCSGDAAAYSGRLSVQLAGATNKNTCQVFAPDGVVGQNIRVNFWAIGN